MNPPAHVAASDALPAAGRVTITIAQILAFAEAVKVHHRTYTWNRAESAGAVVATWDAMGDAVDRAAHEQPAKVVAAINTLLAAAPRAAMQAALQGALDAALVELADAICEIKPVADDADAEEEAAQ